MNARLRGQFRDHERDEGLVLNEKNADAFAGELLRLLERPSVRIVASIELSTMPIEAVNCSGKVMCEAVARRARRAQ